MKKFLNAHYEKIILAVLLIASAALLYYQLLFVQKAQNQDVTDMVSRKEPKSDYDPIDFAGQNKYKMETIFSEWNLIEPVQPSPTATRLMAPYPMSECVYCHVLIPANAYPAIGETKNGKCPVCKKALAPRLKIETDEVLAKNDANGNGLPEEWEKEMKISDEFTSADSDEDTDGFTLLQEYKAKTDPKDPLSHPKYISQVFVSAVSQKKFTGLELVSIDMTKPDKKDWTATINVIRNDKKRTEFVRINVGTFNHQDGRSNVAFSLEDIEMDEKTQEPLAILQRVGKQERIVCRPKQAVYDPMPRVRLLNALYDRNITTQVGSDIKLGTAKTGEELYTIVSADPTTKEVVVKSAGDNPETFTLLPAPKEKTTTATDLTKAAQNASDPAKAKNDDTPFLQK